MSLHVIVVQDDPDHPEGGHALIHFDGLKSVPSGASLVISAVDEASTQEWMVSRPLHIRPGPSGVRIAVDERIVEQVPAGTAVKLSIPEVGAHGEVLWPVLTPLLRQARKGADRNIRIARRVVAEPAGRDRLTQLPQQPRESTGRTSAVPMLPAKPTSGPAVLSDDEMFALARSHRSQRSDVRLSKPPPASQRRQPPLISRARWAHRATMEERPAVPSPPVPKLTPMHPGARDEPPPVSELRIEAIVPAKLDNADMRNDARHDVVRVSVPRRVLGWIAAAAGASAIIWALVFRHELGGALSGIAKALFHSSVPPLPKVVGGAVADISVYAPSRVVLGEEFLVQVFIYDADTDDSRIDAFAAAADAAASRRGIVTLDVDVEPGDRLDFLLQGGDFTIEDTQQSLIWRGKPRSCTFHVRVAPNVFRASAPMRLRVFRQAVPIGQVSFTLAICQAAGPSNSGPVGETAKQYRRAFLSYASQDRAEVIKRAQALRATRVEFFQDLLSLEPGERWERKLYAEIEHCDLFLLFWTRHARASKWVTREINHALKCARASGTERPEILPILLEGPPPPKPPSQLASLHFNDPFLYVIAALDQLAARRPTS